MANEQPQQPFDKEQIYDEQLSPLVTQIIQICEQHKLPLVLSVCYGWNETDKSLCCTTSLPGDGWQPERYHRAIETIISDPAYLAAFTLTKK
jgi:hypothetical protein